MMKVIKAVYLKGQISLAEPVDESGPVEVLLVFPNSGSDSWEKILSESPRVSFLEFVKQVEQETAEGKTEPLDLNKL
jgi:hypothetical protein